MRYPHTVRVSPLGGDDSTNTNGDWQPATPGTPAEMPGRFEVAGTGTPRPVVDGVVTDFAGIVYMPIPETPLQSGQGIEVMYGERLVAKGTVLQYLEGDVSRKNARVWL